MQATCASRPLTAARPAARSPAARRVPCASALPPHLIATLADAAAKPGSVDAPVWAIAVGAVVVTAGALLLASGLKPGTDAAGQIFERDQKSGRKR